MSTINVDIVNPQSASTVTVGGAEIHRDVNGNLAIGDNLNTSMSGNGNVSFGDYAMLNLTSGANNTALGQATLYVATSGSGNTAVGHGAAGAVTTGSQNTAIGIGALSSCNTGDHNIAIGPGALTACTSAQQNIGIGAFTGNLATGGGNIFVGYSCGLSTTIGVNNIIIGTSASAASATSSNSITLGNASHTVIRAAVTSITSLSDIRDKKNVETLPAGLDFINSLKPVKFVWDERDEEGKHDVEDFGFIAQDLKKSQEDAGLSNVLKLVYEENPEKLEASYGKLLPILVKAVQELSSTVTVLKQELETLKK